MNLVENDQSDVRQSSDRASFLQGTVLGRGPLLLPLRLNHGPIQDVTKHLGGHNRDGGLGVQGNVSRLKPDGFGAKLLPQLVELLVGEGLEGCGVDDAFVGG